MKKLNIAGQRYGRLLALESAPPSGRHTRWLFKCDCGFEKVIHLDAVRSGATRSCGCLAAEELAARSLKHGHSVGYTKSTEIKSYQHAKARCTNPADPKYPIYGGRGIKMCDRWLSDASAFLSDMGPKPVGHTLERKDPNGDYCPDNCEWATAHQQARTRRDNVVVHYQGAPMILKDYADLVGVNYKNLHRRIRVKNQSLEEATFALLR